MKTIMQIKNLFRMAYWANFNALGWRLKALPRAKRPWLKSPSHESYGY